MLHSALPLNSTRKYQALGWNGAEGAYTYLVPLTSQEQCWALFFTLLHLNFQQTYEIGIIKWSKPCEIVTKVKYVANTWLMLLFLS